MKLALSKKLGLGVLGLIAAAAFAMVVARSGPLAPVRVTVVEVAQGQVEPELFGIGTVEARRSYLIGPTAAGRVQSVLVDVGDSVKAGQLLAEMDPVDLNDRAAALQASVLRAASGMASAEAQVHDAQARHALAVANAKRYVELGEKNFISASVVEAKLQEQASAAAALKAAQANLAAARQDMARLAAEREGVTRQQQNLRLVAPADGIVISRDAEPGTTVVAGQAVLKLADPQSLWVKTRFDQGRSAGLAEGLSAQIVLRSNPSEVFAGKVARVEPLSDSVTEERIAQIAFDALPMGQTIGELAEVTLKRGKVESALVLPNASIRRRGGVAGVWKLEDGAPQFVPVRLGEAGLDGRVQVLDGLRAGDEVVVYSEKELAPGGSIKVVESLGK
ncbi:MAG: efflux RND transporter periplasmic adaptor subunit [Pseudomonadota bacterium]